MNPSSNKRFLLLVCIIAAGLGCYFVWEKNPTGSPVTSESSSVTSESPSVSDAKPAEANSPAVLPDAPTDAPAPEPAVESASHDLTEGFMQGYGSEKTTIREDLTLVKGTVDSMFMLLKDHVPPFAGNADLVRILQGGNPYQYQILPKQADYLSADGELLDRWGKELFFHRVRGSGVGIRSSGPDQIMWNADDQTWGPEAEPYQVKNLNQQPSE